MSEIGIDVKAINLSSTTPSREKKGVTTEKTPQKAPAEDEDGSPIRHIVCVKNKVDVKHFEDVEDCFILDFDPFEPVQFSKLSVSDNGGGGGSPDIAVVAEKGQVACRDYPHSRHLCLKFPFETTPHESYCELLTEFYNFKYLHLCYCYVCDSAAPCGLWKLSHCHAVEHIGDWKCKRMLMKQSHKKKEVTTKKTPQKAPLSSSAEDKDGSPIRNIVCVKNKVDVKHFENIEDCFILDFDPFEPDPVQLSKLSVSDNGGGGGGGSSDIAVVAEKGQVVCRDYPHSRHLCLKFPFETTPHESYCELCYCYVCDSAAPCGFWKLSHCHAAAHIGDWKCKRMLMKQQAEVKK